MVDDCRLQVLAMPGHTEESAAYLFDEQALFTGDTLYRSLQRLQKLPWDVLILPGHTSE